MIFRRGKPTVSETDSAKADSDGDMNVVSLDDHAVVRDDSDTPKTGLNAASPSGAPGSTPSASDDPSKGPTMATQSTKPPSPGMVPEIPRRAVDIPGSPIRRPGPQPSGPSSRLGGGGEPKLLQVGKDISLSGEITACDTLVVEGTVEAKLEHSHRLEIAQTGTFRGPVKIEEAEIAGLFEGDLTVRGTLSIKGTGTVKGTVRFGKLEIEIGGVVKGDIGPIEDTENG